MLFRNFPLVYASVAASKSACAGDSAAAIKMMIDKNTMFMIIPHKSFDVYVNNSILLS